MTSHDSPTLNEVLAQKQHVLRNKIIDVDEKMLKLVIFSLGDEWYAFYGQNIREILPTDTTVFFVPGCPPSLIGVINVRGDIESVLHIGSVLKLNSHLMPPAGTILLGKTAAMCSGICVDTVIDVVDVPESDIQPASETLPEHLRPQVLGALYFRGRAVTLLNLEKLLTDYRQGLE